MENKEKSESLRILFNGYHFKRKNPKTKHIPIKDRILILLLRKGISQNEMCRRLGINQATISQIYSGICIPSSELQDRICKILECDSLVIFENQDYWGKYLGKTRWLKLKKEVRNSSHD